MQVQPINNQYNQNFGYSARKPFVLSKETISAIESSTGLTYAEMTDLPISETINLMKKRGKIKEPSKLKIWLSNKYKEFGEKFGLLEKHYNFYTED